jgi:phosphotriesterase-related protein
VAALARISAAADVHVVAPCGAYLGASHPAYVRESSMRDLAARFVAELTVGVGDTGIRAGWIGELGVGQPMYGTFLDPPTADVDAMSPDEEKVLEAAGRAQAETGAPISVHIWNWRPNRLGPMAIDAIVRGGGEGTRVAICHVDLTPDLETSLRIVERGAYAELDTSGLELYNDAQGTRYPRDEERIALLRQLIDRRYLRQLLIAQDLCTKTQTTAYGGWGYAHISRNAEPWMRRAGISDADLRTLRVENPARLLAYRP